MNKPLLYFSYLVIVANILILYVGYVANIAFIGSFLGGLMAIGTDPIILMLGALLGGGLVVKPFKLSVVYLWLGAMFLTMLVHVVLGTTKVIVDLVRFDALLIISALIIIATSFFRPLIAEMTEDFEKPITKKAPAKKAPIKKFNKDANKGLRSILIIITISVGAYLLVIPSSRESLVGKNVTQYLLKPFFYSTKILKCRYNNLLVIFCNTVDMEAFIAKNKIEKTQVDKWISNQTLLLPAVKSINGTLEPPLKEVKAPFGEGTFFLKKKGRTDRRGINQAIYLLHPALLIILIFYTWRLRFCITGVTISLFKKIKAAI